MPILLLLLALGASSRAGTAEPVAFATTAFVPAAPPLPGDPASRAEPLDRISADHYRRIFALQADGEWRAADRHIEQLADTRLMGHVLAQRYLHPTKYVSEYRELEAWLRHYADHPQAARIHRLARKKRPAGAAALPELAELGISTTSRKGKAKRAKAPPQTDVAKDPLFRRGLAAWRDGRIADAAQRFEAAALANEKSPWDRSASAYWAALAHLAGDDASEANHWLRIAAEHPLTFYGQLARRRMQLDPAAGGDKEAHLLADRRAVGQTAVQSLLASKRGQRALALKQVGQDEAALAEFSALQAHPDPVLVDAADDAVQMLKDASGGATAVAQGDAPHATTFQYRVPKWKPRDGFKVEPALLYALARQESGFNPAAASPSGAMGLMQLMPTTAGAVAGDKARFLGSGRKALFDPVLNLTLGQGYVLRLLELPEIAGDLILLAAAYNAGPGKIDEWRRQGGDDPLLFIETLPTRQTRLFLQRVLTDFWIYGQKLGGDVSSLDQLALGAWPSYQPRERTAADGAD